jgi:hypothetical protein
MRQTLGQRCAIVVMYSGIRTNVNRLVVQRYRQCNLMYDITTISHTFPHIVNVHKSTEVQMEDVNAKRPYKFTDLCREIMVMTIPGTNPAIDKHNAFVFDAIISILGRQVGAGPTITYRPGNPYAHKLVGKMRKSIVPWLFHYWLQVCGHKLTMVQTLMESIDTEAALIAQFLTFDVNTLEVRTTFVDEDDYLESMEADLSINQGWAADDDNFDKSPKITLEGAHEALQQTL